MRVSAAHASVLFCAAFLTAAAAGASPSVRLPDTHRSLLTAHCLKCHGAEDAEGNVRLDDLPYEITSVETAERWQKVLNVLNSGAMPPEDEPPLDPTAKADLVDDLAQTMVAARKSLADQRGTITMRRLNRREYRNTLRELLGAEINVAELPADTGNGSFDTVGSNLFMSSNQFEQYQALGREAIEEALARHSARSVVQRHRYEAEQAVRKLVKVINEEIEQRDRARRWVAAVDAAAARSRRSASRRRTMPNFAGRGTASPEPPPRSSMDSASRSSPSSAMPWTRPTDL
jgi:hypothetical protein